MRTEVFGDGDDDLAFVLGWANKPEYAGLQWLIGHLVDAGYRVHAIEIPRVIADFDVEYRKPVADYVDRLDDYRLLGHSTGGLIGEFLEGPTTRVYCSPWWGLHEDLKNPLVSLLMRLPTRRRLLPVDFDRDDLGELAGDRQVAEVPDRVAPTFLREAARAQARLPPVHEGTVVFYTPGDPVVSAEAIRARVTESNAVTYQGGHELFNSPARETHLETLLSAVESGAEALD